MNANLRGDVRIRGMAIEDFVTKIVLRHVKSSDSEKDSIPAAEGPPVEDLLQKSMKPLQEFQDEKKIMIETLEKLETRVGKLESVPFTSDIDAIQKSVEKLERKVIEMKPKRGVDQNTLDLSLAEVEKKVEVKIKEVADAVAGLRKELEE